jgi:hypothetical protein
MVVRRKLWSEESLCAWAMGVVNDLRSVLGKHGDTGRHTRCGEPQGSFEIWK